MSPTWSSLESTVHYKLAAKKGSIGLMRIASRDKGPGDFISWPVGLSTNWKIQDWDLLPLPKATNLGSAVTTRILRNAPPRCTLCLLRRKQNDNRIVTHSFCSHSISVSKEWDSSSACSYHGKQAHGVDSHAAFPGKSSVYSSSRNRSVVSNPSLMSIRLFLATYLITTIQIYRVVVQIIYSVYQRVTIQPSSQAL